MASTNKKFSLWILFVFFFVSGFCSLVYQVIWTRLAFASFGIITPVLSVVISVFMLGLSLGSWAGGRFATRIAVKTRFSAATFYAAAEFLIGLSAWAVPKIFTVGERFLLTSGGGDSFRYLFLSATVLAISILPWCVLMGATFPLMMAFIRERNRGVTDSFSYLYVANVLGAMCGTFCTAVVFVELLGFHNTLRVAAAGNFIIALVSFMLGASHRREPDLPFTQTAAEPNAKNSSNGLIKWILFFTGFCSLAMEVVWTRIFTPVLKTQVYSFALVVFVYLGATLVGSLWYRRHLKKGREWNIPLLMALLAVSVLLPIPASDPRFVQMDMYYSMNFRSVLIVLASIFPLCAILGYLTPGLVDKFSLGNPAAAGRAYAINVLGCILGPLAASYLLLPLIDERAALIVLSLPILAFYCLFWKSLPALQRLGSALAGGLLLIYSFGFSHSFADSFLGSSSRIEVRRDYAASVISADPEGEKKLLVNGMGMTSLTPITKFMIHLPMGLHEGPADSILVICFGMGTSYRSGLSWDMNTTAVELIPSVPKALEYYHADAAAIRKNPKGHIVIDDGRRFLNRTQRQYDLVAIDPPPPMAAAGSSLLYSTEFYDAIKKRLKPNGIVQVWLPGGDRLASLAVVRSTYVSFPYVRCFPSVEGWGVHILASMQPIPQRTPDELVARMPASARKDLLEWADGTNAAAYLGKVVLNEVPTEKLLNPDPDVRIVDDAPMNEYFLLRKGRPF
jgi:spermidine synthase